MDTQEYNGTFWLSISAMLLTFVGTLTAYCLKSKCKNCNVVSVLFKLRGIYKRKWRKRNCKLNTALIHIMWNIKNKRLRETGKQAAKSENPLELFFPYATFPIFGPVFRFPVSPFFSLFSVIHIYNICIILYKTMDKNKVLWHTIKLRIPSEMISIGKNGVMTVKQSFL